MIFAIQKKRKDVNQANARKAMQLNRAGQQGQALTKNLIFYVQKLTETAKCESMLGGVRGRGSNSPTY